MSFDIKTPFTKTQLWNAIAFFALGFGILWGASYNDRVTAQAIGLILIVLVGFYLYTIFMKSKKPRPGPSQPIGIM